MEQGCKKAYAPYSKFRVAQLLLDNGQTVLGSNQNAAYPLVCAERVAIFSQELFIPKILKWLSPQLPTQHNHSPYPCSLQTINS
jgi:cytidine deaminase